jgi:translation initiation factor 2 alpha subunit (eIF-2alpha)
MSEIEIREKMTRYVSQRADEKFLRMIYAMMQAYETEEYTEMSKAETEAYNRELEEAEKAIDGGEFTTQEQLRKEIKNWQ